MTVREAIAIRIKQLCAERNLTVNSFANIAGMSPYTIYGIFNKENINPEVVTVKQICDGFEITLGQFFSTEVFDNLEQEIK